MKKLKTTGWIFTLLISILLFACNNNAKVTQAGAVEYTCPMPGDSFFSDRPGNCPKCGMQLIEVKNKVIQRDDSPVTISKNDTSGYTCPMHPQIHSDTAGVCSICGMTLEKIKSTSQPNAVSMETLLKPANEQVVASVSMVHTVDREEDIEMEAYGFITYDTRHVGVIATNVAGRIEKLYVSYRFQHISKGQKILEIYSPELLTAQQNLLFVLKNDPTNTVLSNAAKQKLLLLGMGTQQLAQVMQSGKPAFRVAVYSNYGGHIHESSSDGNINNPGAAAMKDVALVTKELALKEGMYLQKGQNIFSVFNPDKAWAVIDIFAAEAALVKVGDKVRVIPETNPQNDFRATISYIEPVFRNGSKTVSARVYFDNAALKIPVGSQVKVNVFAGNRIASWLPEEAVLSLGLNKVVFVREGESFVARKIETGIVNKHLIQVLNGLKKNEAVAANAQYLVDSESFIKAN
jgi:Cu(I)/Ag(I) efflux system membrane fusion protein